MRLKWFLNIIQIPTGLHKNKSMPCKFNLVFLQKCSLLWSDINSAVTT